MAEKHFNLADLFEMVAEAVPDRTAVVCDQQRATYRQLDERANQLAHFLRSRGVTAGQHVGLYLYNCNEYLEGVLACFKLRAVPININYRYVREELEYMFDNADMVACIHHREFVPHIAEVRSRVPALRTFVAVEDGSTHALAAIDAVEYEAALRGQSADRDFGERADDDLFILYTGGTTGMPKGVMWPHKAIFFAALGGGSGMRPVDGPCQRPEEIVARVAQYPIKGMPLAPLMHGACWWYALIQLLAGNELVLNPHRHLDGTQVWDIVERERVNSVSIVGDAMAVPLLDALDTHRGRWNLDCVFNVGSGGAVFSQAKQERFQHHFPNGFIYNSFGSSESGSTGQVSTPDQSASGFGRMAKSEFLDVLIDEGGRLRCAQPGETGIIARCGYIPIGYYKDPKKTAQTFVQAEGKSWILTGDAGTLQADQTITLFGRGSNCIESGGEKVFPEEVEQAIKAHPEVTDALVVGTPDSRWGSKVTAVIATRGRQRLSLESIQQEARKHIAGYKVPRELHIVDEVPRAPSGKPNYVKAKQLALSGTYRVS